MKNFLKTLIICLMLLIVPIVLIGCTKEEKDIDLRVKDGYVQWTNDGDGWENLIALEDLKGEQGVQGEKGEQGKQGIQGVTGLNGKQIEFSKNTTHILWRYVGDSNWQELVTLSEIKGNKGDPGTPGQDLIAQECIITYNFNLGKSVNEEIDSQLLSIFDKGGFEKAIAEVQSENIVLKYTQKENKGNYFNLYSGLDLIGLKDYFMGWFVEDVKVNGLHIVGGNVELTAKWSKPLSSIICSETVDYRFYDNSGTDFTVSAFPKENANYDENGVGYTSFRLNELTIYNGKFYKIDEYFAYLYGTVNGMDIPEDPYVECIYVPDTASAHFSRDIDMHMNWSKDCFYRTSSGQDYIGNYVIKSYYVDDDPLSSSSDDPIIELIYKVDYDSGEAVLVKTFALTESPLVNNSYIFVEDFEINKDGQTYNFKVTKINVGWFEIFYTIQSSVLLNNSVTLNVLITSKNVRSIGEVSTVIPNGFDKEGYKLTEYNLTVNYYLYQEDSNMQIEFDGEYNATPNGQYINDNYFYYSKTEPTDTENKYWHWSPLPEVWDLSK